MSPQLKLIALDADDLAVISTHVQDARVQVSDIIWRQAEKRLVVGMSRLDWEQTLELVGIEFHSREAPGGSAVLMFAHGEALRLDVECLECELTDLGPEDLGAGVVEEGGT